MRIFLIGFMGSGKTHWGKLMSQKMKLAFYDLDEEVVRSDGRPITKIFNEDGEEFFRYKEKAVLEALIADHEAVVISCGGGTPCFFKNIDLMKRSGRVIWLNTSVDALVARLLKEKQTRPLIKTISDQDLRAHIIKKLQDRRLYYEQADTMVHEETITIDSLIKTALDA
ncbi:MAG: shikimate kinase [Gemmatimonadaceae bacterium]|nr:shikimate kinase [Chitinophagaceae bacterium]